MRSARAMNVSRGLFRTWVLVTVLWLCLAVLMGLTSRLPFGSNSTGAFQYVPNLSLLSVQQLKDIVAGRWPSALPSALDDKSAEFSELDYAPLLEWNSLVADGKLSLRELPDGSKLYFRSSDSPEEKEYLAREFWGGRWSRWFKNMYPGILIALTQPIALFIFGYACLWAGR